MSLAILGIGTALPSTLLTQVDALAINGRLSAAATDKETWLPGIYEGTGIRNRYTVHGVDVIRDILNGTRNSGSPFLPTPDHCHGPSTRQRMRHYAELAPPLAIGAATKALEQSGRTAASVTHLVTVSCTGFFAPGVDVALMRALQLESTVQRTHVGFMGCHGAINGLRVARAFADATDDVCVLLCAIELCTLHFHYGDDPQQLIANALFGDGAAAVVGVPADTRSANCWRVATAGSCLLPNSVDAMTWTIGDYGFTMTLSKAVPKQITTRVRPWLESWLAEQGLTLADVASWAVHPGGPRILAAVEEGLGLPQEALATSREVLAECGNMSSPTVLFILDRLQSRRAPRPCVMLSFGPGLMAEAILLQ